MDSDFAVQFLVSVKGLWSKS